MPKLENLLEQSGVQTTVSGNAIPQFLQTINHALSAAEELTSIGDTETRVWLPGRLQASLALSAAVQCVSALFSAASVKCNLANPPEDIEIKVDNSGKLVYQCFHDPPHEWDLTGTPLP